MPSTSPSALKKQNAGPLPSCFFSPSGGLARSDRSGGGLKNQNAGLFDGSHALLQVIDDQDGSDLSGITGMSAYDAGATLQALAAGHYRLTLTASGNDAIGPLLSSGFSLDGQAPIALSDWTQPSSDINKNDQKGGVWQLHLTGVDQAAMVPEPSSLVLMLAGMVGLGLSLLRRIGAR